MGMGIHLGMLDSRPFTRLSSLSIHRAHSWKLSFAETQEPPKIFFDHENDTVWFSPKFRSLRDFAAAVTLEERTQIRRIALTWERVVADAPWFMSEFPTLEEMVLVGSERNTLGEKVVVKHDVSEEVWGSGRTISFVENFDGEKEWFRVTYETQLEDVFLGGYVSVGRNPPSTKYMDFTREHEGNLQLVDRLRWLEMGE